MKKLIVLFFLITASVMAASDFNPGQKWILSVYPEANNQLYEFITLVEFDGAGKVYLFTGGRVIGAGEYRIESHGENQLFKMYIRTRDLDFSLEIEALIKSTDKAVKGAGIMAIFKDGGWWPGASVKFDLTRRPKAIARAE